MILKIFLITFIFFQNLGAQPADDFAVPADTAVAPAEVIENTPQEAVPSAAPVAEDGFVDSAVTPEPFVVPQGIDPLLEGFFEDTNYSPQDKRDPFFPYLMLQRIQMVKERPQVPQEPLQMFALSELKVVGIIWDVGRPKALVLDPSGKSYIVTENAKMGKEYGYIAAIREGEVIVVEEVYDPSGKKSFVTKILKLNAGTQNTAQTAVTQ